MASILGEKIAGEVVRKGSDVLFDKALEKYKEDNNLSEDERNYIQQVIDLTIEFETLYRFYITSRSSSQVGRFADEVTPLGRKAAELAAVGELRNYEKKDPQVLSQAVSVAQLFQQYIPEINGVAGVDDESDNLEEELDKQDIQEYYAETELARDLITTVSREFNN